MLACVWAESMKTAAACPLPIMNGRQYGDRIHEGCMGVADRESPSSRGTTRQSGEVEDAGMGRRRHAVRPVVGPRGP